MWVIRIYVKVKISCGQYRGKFDDIETTYDESKEIFHSVPLLLEQKPFPLWNKPKGGGRQDTKTWCINKIFQINLIKIYHYNPVTTEEKVKT